MLTINCESTLCGLMLTQNVQILYERFDDVSKAKVLLALYAQGIIIIIIIIITRYTVCAFFEVLRFARMSIIE